jgi:hypothetical protein
MKQRHCGAGLPAIDASGTRAWRRGLTLEGVDLWRILEIEIYRVKNKKVVLNSIEE